MTRRLSRLGICAIAAVAATLACSARGDGAATVERYVWQATRDGGAAVVQNPAGGQWVYARGDFVDGRPQGRFALGKPARTEYTLFSAEEEEALWELRQKRLAPPKPRQHKQLAHREPMNWPRVVLRGTSTCVPERGFSDADDWQQHLVCWSKEAQRVE